jgi:hypothetical protein
MAGLFVTYVPAVQENIEHLLLSQEFMDDVDISIGIVTKKTIVTSVLDDT